jgi:hypothetical protein
MVTTVTSITAFKTLSLREPLKAYVEAEQWAGEKATLSAEDREFLAASRAQLREEEIVAKERESELAREKQAREAAEAAKQIQAEANLQAQRKIRRGSLVLGSALAAAVVFGGLALGAVGQVRMARQLREKARNELTQALSNLDKKRNELGAANLAIDQAKQTIKESLKQANQAKYELEKSEEKLTAINTHVDTVNELSRLVGELYAYKKPQDEQKPEIARDSIAHIGLSFTEFTEGRPDFRKALLSSSISLANLHLDPQDKNDQANIAINQSIRIIEENQNLFNSSSSGRAIAFFSYAVQGNLLEEKGREASSLAAYKSKPSGVHEDLRF